MVTLVILSAGIVFIYKTFFLCVDYLSRLSLRLQANELIDEKIADLGRLYRETGDLSFSRGPAAVTQEINHRSVDFSYQIQLVPVPGYEGLYRLQVGVSWLDAGRPTSVSREAMLGL